MLKLEQAEERLAEWRAPSEENRIAEGVSRLPKKLQEAATWAFDLKDDDTYSFSGGWEDRRRLGREAAIQIDRLPAKERGRVFGVVNPKLVPVMEAAWQLVKTTPYQVGYTKKAFRAPYNPDVLAARLHTWMAGMAAVGQRYHAEALTPAWLAAWAPHLQDGHYRYSGSIGIVLAAVLNRRNGAADEVFDILIDSLNGQHEIGAPGRHVYSAFLLCDRPEAWEAVEKTLLAAQRQEGLRQAILETIDLSHPEAFRRMLRLVLDHDLMRFSSVVRAVDVWFGQLWAAASGGVIKKMLTQVVEFLENPAARVKALQEHDAQAAFLALWCAATEDAFASVPLAEELLGAKSAELRYVAARHLLNLDLNVAAAALVPALDDDDLRVAVLATGRGHYGEDLGELPKGHKDDRFERLERLVDRVDKKPQTLEAIVWPWTESSVKQTDVAECLLPALGERPATRLIPHLGRMAPIGRYRAVTALVETKKWDASIREAVVDLAGDASGDVRGVALKALLERKLKAGEIERLEAYLTRKSSDLRCGVLDVLLKQTDEAALASAARLLAAKNANQRLAGLELLRHLCDAKRSVDACRKQAAAYQAARKKINRHEQAHLDEIATDKVAPATLADALGFMDPAERTPVVAPRNLKVPFITPAAVSCLKSLDDLVHEHRETPIQYENYSGKQEELLGNVQWGFPSPKYHKLREGQEAMLPIADVWKAWYADRPKEFRDKDGLELVRSLIWSELCNEWRAAEWKQWAASTPARQKAATVLSGRQEPLKLRYSHLVEELLEWLLFLHPCDASDYLLDALETAYALVPPDDLAQLNEPLTMEEFRGYFSYHHEGDWRYEKAFEMWHKAILAVATINGIELTPDQQVRLWRLMHWRDEPFAGARRRRPPTRLLRVAYSEGAANLTDVVDHLLAERGTRQHGVEVFDLLREITARKPDKEIEKWLKLHPEIRDLTERAVAKILEMELTRGDAPTAATSAARSIRAVWGIETLRRILHALGKDGFRLGCYWSRQETPTRLAKVAFPADGETPDDFVAVMKEAVREGQFPEERLLQLTFLAPQWIPYVEKYLGWPHLSEGVYWFLAHMQYIGGLGEVAAEAALADDSDDDAGEADEQAEGDDDNGQVGKRKKLSAWDRLILERTPLSDADRDEGAIDVPWFQRTYALLKDKRWQQLAAAARFAANASQAKRAAYIGDVLLNRVPRKELVDGIEKRQLKENVRLLGLLPLAKGKRRETDLMQRCCILREYRRYANKLSGLTKPSALRAWEIGMRNLAQTAGFADPLRLQWAVGAEELKDLAAGPLVVEKGGVTVTLALDDLSKPVLTVQKGEKTLKSIPPAIKKDKKVAELVGRVKDLKRQASSIRQSLEAAMCRGDTFTGEELRAWCDHALLTPLLTRLVVIGEGIAGYPDKGGKALRDHAGKLEPVKAKETLRLAHPHDLLESGRWHDWQRECFQAERVQPFKQVFRELYVLTKQEKKDGGVSHRYDGQQIQPRQSVALFGQRGWNTDDGVFKVFHDLGLTASVHFQCGVTTPLEVEDATLAGVSFARRDEWKPIPLADVPPRPFSEVMRDLDLVVSVAHAGGVDPEASASTVEMRAGLLRETCTLLNLSNVRFKPSHALIDGELANYSIHLGSGTVHKMPGGALCVVPVHAQHRGRLFLPFADDDPKTAEVISKVLLLARDDEIQDPTILEQIRA